MLFVRLYITKKFVCLFPFTSLVLASFSLTPTAPAYTHLQTGSGFQLGCSSLCREAFCGTDGMLLCLPPFLPQLRDSLSSNKSPKPHKDSPAIPEGWQQNCLLTPGPPPYLRPAQEVSPLSLSQRSHSSSRAQRWSLGEGQHNHHPVCWMCSACRNTFG